MKQYCYEWCWKALWTPSGGLKHPIHALLECQTIRSLERLSMMQLNIKVTSFTASPGSQKNKSDMLYDSLPLC